MINLPSVSCHSIIDENLPWDPRERFRYQIAQVMEPYMGQFLTPEVKLDIESRLKALYKTYLAQGIFPQELWDLDHKVHMSWLNSELNLSFPIWIFRWLEDGEIMTVEDVKTYMRGDIESKAIIKRWINMEPWNSEGEES